MIVVGAAAVVDALTAVEGTDELRARLPSDGLHAPSLLDYEVVAALRGLTIDCPLLTRDARLARSAGHDVSVEVC